MHGDVPYLQASIQFVFYVVALVLFGLAALLPAERRGRLGPVNLVPAGLAVTIAPSCYILFKAAFHRGSIFH